MTALPFGEAPIVTKDQLALTTATILSGEADRVLDELEIAIKRRRGVIATLRVADIENGDTFRLTTSMRPRMISGALCRVVAINTDGEHLAVELLEHKGNRWTYGARFTISKLLVGEVFK